MQITTTRRTVALVAALALSMSACGQSDHDATPPNQSTPSAAADQASPSGEEATDHDGAPSPRLLVADGTEPSVAVIDLTSGEPVATLEVSATARLHGTDRHVFAASRELGRVEVIDGGSWLESHGDHDHPATSSPEVTDHGFAADEPTHFTDHGDLTAIFNDGDGSVLVLDRTKLGTDEATVATLRSGSAHHGVAVALADENVAIISQAPAGEQLPDAVALVDLESGKELQRFDDCPGLHGEAATEDLVAFGCKDGVLVLEHAESGWSAHKITRPDGTGPEDRTGSLEALPDASAFIGNLSSEALVRIDAASKQATRLPLPGPMASYAIDGGGNLLVATTDGKVHHLDGTTGEVRHAVDAVDAFTLPEGHSGPPTPTLFTFGEHVFLTDPDRGQVVELSTDGGLAIERTLDVGGTPAFLTVVGLPAH